MFYSPADLHRDIIDVSDWYLKNAWKGRNYIYGVPRGGCLIAQAIAAVSEGQLSVIYSLNGLAPEEVIIVDDIVDSGRTMARFPDPYMRIALHARTGMEDAVDYVIRPKSDEWIHYWWEGEDASASIEDAVVRQLQYIGEDIAREGLAETPKRVVKAWDELFAGYKIDPASVMKTFTEGSCDEMVLLKDITFYSVCEHHLLPFSGKAHIAYIPNGRVLGVSKLSRLLDIYARRAQIQERIGEQVTTALMDYLQPLGAGCIIEAQHLCMTSRGVQKQDSVMVTSSLKGVFRQPEVRAEFMGLVK